MEIGQAHVRWEQIFANPPQVHVGESEVIGEFLPPQGSIIPEEDIRLILSREPYSLGIDLETGHFILDHADANCATLETGAGCSTLAFALCGSRHIAVTPHGTEAVRIREYAAVNGIDIANVRFQVEGSELFLPRLDSAPLDLALIDGKHAFPWPILDWFFTAARLKTGGTIILDDKALWTVQVLGDFLKVDANWTQVFESRKAMAFEKTSDDVLNIPWYMQRFVASKYQT